MSQKLKRNRTKSSLTWAIALFTTITSLLSACGGSGESGTSSGGGLKLGGLFPITGDLSAVGQNLPVAAKLAVDTVNACGGINGKPVTFVTEDDQTDPTAGSAAMTKLAEVEKVAGVVGSFASSVSGAAVDIAVRNKVMMISPASTSPVFTDRAKKGDFQGYWARTAPSDFYQSQALAALANKKGFKKVSTVVINNDYGVGFEKEFVNTFKKLGGTVINEKNPVRHDPKAATLDSEAASAFAGKPDAVAAVLYAETGSILLKSAFEQGLTKDVTILLTDGVYTEDFVKQTGQTSDGKSIISGALGTVPGANGKALADFTKLWKEKTNKETTAYVAHSWDAAVVSMLAAEASKQNTGDGIKSKLQEVASAPGQEVSDPCAALKLIKSGQDINYQGASGNVDFDSQGDVIGSYDVWTVEPDGALKIVDKVDLGK
ncbi:MAG: ABC transporter substrate-binding protein [Xenococcaceae cyanobacterium]